MLNLKSNNACSTERTCFDLQHIRCDMHEGTMQLSYTMEVERNPILSSNYCGISLSSNLIGSILGQLISI